MDFEKILKELKESLLQVLGDQYGGFKKETKKDIEDFLNASKDKLERWTKLLASGDISMDEYQWLVKSQKDLLAMKGLEKVGISKISLGHFKNKVIKTVVDIVKGIIF
ncbi:hypothetical protein [Flagellimonas onchidii]|uniref:hypothetical protein n=1 Tax=Flagellimonas onchidii TaxID=2562684 RepID=UPI0010A64C38|nr:hypothetical protein [Allomuricauda onchidii]